MNVAKQQELVRIQSLNNNSNEKYYIALQNAEANSMHISNTYDQHFKYHLSTGTI